MFTVIFNNRTAGEESTIQCDKDSVEDVVEWYPSHYAGDDYTVLVEGYQQELDRNGQIKKGLKEWH